MPVLCWFKHRWVSMGNRTRLCGRCDRAEIWSWCHLCWEEDR